MRQAIVLFALMAITVSESLAQLGGDAVPDSSPSTKNPGARSTLGDGTTFVKTMDAAVDNGAWSVTSGDWDGDGDLDLATACRWSSTVVILTNDGLAHFARSSTIRVGERPLKISAADFDHDGDVDLAVTNWISNTVSILKNDGSGSFAVTSTVTVGSKPQGIAAIDLDGDTYADLVATNSFGNSLSLLKNNQQGGFTLLPSLLVEQSPTDVLARDLNGDGSTDLVVTNYYSSSISVLLHDGSGGFSQVTLGVENSPSSSAAADWNQDGYLDLAVVNNPASSITIFNGDGAGHFDFDSTLHQDHPPGFTVEIASGDWDRDGYTDFAVTNGTANSMSVFHNDSTGRFREVAVISTGPASTGIAGGDWNNDGKLDLAVSNDEGNTVSILENHYAVTGVAAVPGNVSLLQNYPNPFRRSTWITFELAARSTVLLRVFDAHGREITTLVAGELSPGRHSYEWNARAMASGLYFYRLEAPTWSKSKKGVLLSR